MKQEAPTSISRSSSQLIQGREIGTVVNDRQNRIGKLEKTIFDRKEDQYRFTFENGYTLVIQRPVFFQHTLVRQEDECVYFEFSPEPILSGVFAYSLFETYGFPLEFTIDEMKRNGMSVDETGYHIMEELSRARNKNTYIDKSAFGRGETE